ncbi:MAG: hypothetical protein JNK05_38600 [Myxococcales bacterium]|nr:hypothetical protein [Myxococcales bacterium]
MIASLAWLVSSCGEPAPTDVFIAMQRDFEGFAGWTRTDLGTVMLAGHPPGPRAAYVNRPLERGATEYPVGAIIVKVIHAGGADPSQWALFAMAKRGGGYNDRGARGWEFFTLRMQGDSPVIVGRGINPPPDGDAAGDPYHLPDGVGCNSCHGTEDARANDSVLTTLLRPGA